MRFAFFSLSSLGGLPVSGINVVFSRESEGKDISFILCYKQNLQAVRGRHFVCVLFQLIVIEHSAGDPERLGDKGTKQVWS